MYYISYTISRLLYYFVSHISFSEDGATDELFNVSWSSNLHEIINPSRLNTDGGRLHVSDPEPRNMSRSICVGLDQAEDNVGMNKKSVSRQLSRSLCDNTKINCERIGDYILNPCKLTSHISHAKPPSGKERKSRSSGKKNRSSLKEITDKPLTIEDRRKACLQNDSSLFGKYAICNHSSSIMGCVSSNAFVPHLNQLHSISSSRSRSVNLGHLPLIENTTVIDQEDNQVSKISM